MEGSPKIEAGEFATLRARSRGALLSPGEEGHEARRIWNAHIAPSAAAGAAAASRR